MRPLSRRRQFRQLLRRNPAGVSGAASPRRYTHQLVANHHLAARPGISPGCQVVLQIELAFRPVQTLGCHRNQSPFAVNLKLVAQLLIVLRKPQKPLVHRIIIPQQRQDGLDIQDKPLGPVIINRRIAADARWLDRRFGRRGRPSRRRHRRHHRRINANHRPRRPGNSRLRSHHRHLSGSARVEQDRYAASSKHSRSGRLRHEKIGVSRSVYGRALDSRSAITKSRNPPASSVSNPRMNSGSSSPKE